MNIARIRQEKVTWVDPVRTAAPICVGMSGLPGSGKTLSALRLATGLTGGEGIYMIDADNGRGTQYNKQFKYKYTPIRAPFHPLRAANFLEQAVEAGAKCVIVDPISNFWEGDGGVLDLAEEAKTRLAGDDEAKRDRMAQKAWGIAKAPHKIMARTIEQLPCHLILLFRAHPKLPIGKDAKGKMTIGEREWTPIMEQRLAAFATINLMLDPGGRGRPDLAERNTKFDEYNFGRIFKTGEQITEDTGRALAAWAMGDEPPKPAPKPRLVKTDVLATIDNDVPTDDRLLLRARAIHAALTECQTRAGYNRIIEKGEELLDDLQQHRPELFEAVERARLAAYERQRAAAEGGDNGKVD